MTNKQTYDVNVCVFDYGGGEGEDDDGDGNSTLMTRIKQGAHIKQQNTNIR